MCFSSGGTKTITVPASSTSANTVSTSSAAQEQVAAPTYADASVTKATTQTRNKAAALAGRDIRTSTRGLQNESEKEKRGLLGG